MEEQSKIIGQIGKKNPFKVPENYFEDFSAQLEQKLQTIPVAPAPASALLSGILTKTGVYGVIVISMEMFRENVTWAYIILMIFFAKSTGNRVKVVI